jgi:hypothetical protein
MRPRTPPGAPGVPVTVRPGYTGPNDPSMPRGLRQWSRPEPQAQEYPDEGSQPGQVITPPPGGVYYQPGLPSTGRLDIRLLPRLSSETDRASRG